MVKDFTTVMGGGVGRRSEPYTLTPLTVCLIIETFSFEARCTQEELPFFWVQPNGEALATLGSSPTGPLILLAPLKRILYLMCLGL